MRTDLPLNYEIVIGTAPLLSPRAKRWRVVALTVWAAVTGMVLARWSQTSLLNTLLDLLAER